MRTVDHEDRGHQVDVDSAKPASPPKLAPINEMQDFSMLSGRELPQVREKLEHNIPACDRAESQFFDDQWMAADSIQL